MLAMADNASPTDPTTRPPLHPFFVQNRPIVLADKQTVNNAPAAVNSPTLPPNTTADDKPDDDGAKNPLGRRSARRKADQENNHETDQSQPRKRARNSAGGNIAEHFVQLGHGVVSATGETNDADGSSTGASTPKDMLPSNTSNEENHGGPGFSANNPQPELRSAVQFATEPETNGCVCESTIVPQASRTAEGSLVKPKKLLQFNPKTGTIGSPPRPKNSRLAMEEHHDTEKTPPARRGRKPASKVVRITYGTDSTTSVKLGELISTILTGQSRYPIADTGPSPQSSDKMRRSPQATKKISPKPAKATHPFFLGQAKKSGLTPQDPKPEKGGSLPLNGRTKQYTSTPCSPRKPRGPASRAPVPIPQFGVKNLGVKSPGAKLPAWPWKGMVHVRGDQDEILSGRNDSLPLPFRKSKGNAVKVPPGDSIISLLTQSMELPVMVEAVRNINTDDFIPAPPELRLPEKHFESGSKLQFRILRELRTFHSSLSSKKSALHNESIRGAEGSMQQPPQLARLFNSTATSLSAFDMSQCETTNWVHKYAPTSAVEVLQPGREAFLLRDWLQALMVQSVDTGSTESDKHKAGSKTKPPGASKKKRRKKLEGFIVSSEDEDYELYELSDEEDSWAPSGGRGIVRKTVVRSHNLANGTAGDKTANTLVISGPHGCGKTAAVYAVANELDFEVFEINTSSRRSGKDVLEKIGDMTKNHHVQQHQSTDTVDNQDATAGDGTANDIKPGQQSTMNSFFKPKNITAKLKQPANAAAKSVQREAKKEPPKTQRQSLILLEEVDVLYEEDKQFWATVIGLIAQSKRPFIMTCNDETLVPLHTLRLHGIFRLSNPPRDLAVDRLLLVAANEGHALARQSVEQLYDSRGHDLRAATMDLQYWCQIGVGDRRGGLDWFYPRWPGGVDLDENKETVRVVSQDTYRPGMNLLGRDSIIDPRLSPRLVEEEVLHQAWELWSFDIGHWQDSVGLRHWADSISANFTTQADRLGVLEAYDLLTEAMSAADVLSAKSFATFKEEAVDTTQPELPPKMRDDLVLGLTHIDTPVTTQYDSLTTLIPSTLKSLAKSSLLASTESPKNHCVAALRPLDEMQAIHCLQTSFTSTMPGTPAIGRMDFAFAFDPIATADTSPLQPVSYLEPSVFDRTLKLITLDVAPYVRSIVMYECKLQKQRLKLSNLVSEGGRGALRSKRMRTTKAALSALEGGSRTTTRGERWFKASINSYLVAKTAGERWNGCESGSFQTPDKPQSPPAGSPKTSPDATPTKAPKRAVLKGRKRRTALQDDDEAEELGC